MHPRDLKIEDFTYQLPDDRIAKYPLEERDAARLLIYKAGDITEDSYLNIAEYIPAGALMVFNQTRVVHARLVFTKETGGKIEVFCLEPGNKYADIQTAMLQKGCVEWHCLVGGAGKWKDGQVLQMTCIKPEFKLTASILERKNGTYILKLQWDDTTISFAEVLHYCGRVPLPPYLHREAETGDNSRYQTVYAKDDGSVAAPTAGLHFTERVLQNIEQKGIDKALVTLHVGAGTFKPVKSETMAAHDMHAEWIEVSKQALEQLMAHADGYIVPVGTTSLRTIESLYWIGCKLLQGMPIDFEGVALTQWEPYELDASPTIQTALNSILHWLQKEGKEKIVTRTQILIAPGYRFKVATGLVTNFHQPHSTLLLLIAALVGDEWRRIYEYAMGAGFRFLSYGDGCLLWRVNK
ncbi:MAG: S-adenosylmethionine:tRNA ribosyltransferase-isomerase [Flavipsychrobacter sp.]|nr:S-adenosylmethionine:tRNA ribosyltransferase-isomerase [Flavipsychrobacter sp.]